MKKLFLLSTALLTFTSLANVEILRSADRPQLTEKPQTVGRGIFQLEGSLAEYGYEKDGNYKMHNVNLLVIEAKYGLSPILDLFLEFESFRHFSPSAPLRSSTGIGDIALGAEYNIWANPDYNASLSVAPFVSMPSNTHDFANNAVEFGVKLPFAMELKDEFTFGAMIEVDVFEDVSDQDGYHFELVNSVSVTKPIADPIALYAEYYSRNTFEDDQAWASLLGLGGVYAMGEKLLVDSSLRIGLSEGAEDAKLVIGASYRF